ncbi:MAG: TolC family protein [Paludibacteraceae bacterium]|nr:TolC family protein [Paludibacteraceae bacterium]
MLSKKLFIPVAFLLLSSATYCQEIFKDTLKISSTQAENTFIKQNLLLLSEKFNVDAAKAQTLQAKLFNNPTIQINQGAINPEYKTNGGKHYFDMTSTGETSVQIQKLFLLAGKRNKQIKMAELSANKEEQNYFNLIRTLKYSLRGGFYNIYYLEQIIKVYDKEIASLNKVVNVFQSQYEKGYVSKKELLRIESTLFTLESEKLGFSTQLVGSLTDFNVLMHTSSVYYVPQPDTVALAQVSISKLNLQSLVDTAIQGRYDLKMAKYDLSANQANLSYQRALSIPDVTLSAGWDKNGGYVHDYSFIGLQFDLPVFNRNQGNIKSAKLNVESSRYKVQSAEEQVRADVMQAYAGAYETDKVYRRFDTKFMSDLEGLNGEMMKNYLKKNISLIEFLDYYDAYKQNAVQLNNLLYNRANSFETINYSVGKDVVK